MVFINERDVRRTLSILRDPGELFEVRIVRGKQTYSGYFTNPSMMLSELAKVDLHAANIYVVLNKINPECGGRSARDRFVYGATATGDKDIISRQWMLVDIDPKRPKDTSSTDEQVRLAREMANKVYLFLKNTGFNAPVTAFSGNGCHLLYKIDMPVDAASEKLIKQFLKTLDILFSDENVKIDTVNFNASRVCKLYGTMAQKGSSTETQPHRMSHVISCPDMIKPTGSEYLQKIIDMMPTEPERPQAYNGYNSESFDLVSWLTKYGLTFHEQNDGDGTKYLLDHCPFDENHKGKDAMIYRRNNGAIGFHCFHDSCAGRRWKDVRMLFEPNAYEKREKMRDWSEFSQRNRETFAKASPIVAKNDVPIFESPLYILEKPTPEDTFVKTGIHKIDDKMRGLRKGAVSLTSGLRGSGKSTLLSQMVLNAVNDGNNVAVFSGELTDKNFMRWMYQQAAGKQRTVPTDSDRVYVTPRKYMEQIARWLDGRLWLYNNDYGFQYEAVIDQFERAVDEKKLDFLLLDNLMAFDIRTLSKDKYDAQTAFVLNLTRIAKKYNIHIMFVAHPRKAQGFLRLEDISGTNDLVNAVDAALIIHRVNNDFKIRAKEYFKWKSDNDLLTCDNVIEIAKDRETGMQDAFIPLYFEKESKRLKNYQAEYVRYGWEVEKGQNTSETPKIAKMEPRRSEKPKKIEKKPDSVPEMDGFMKIDDSDDDFLEIPF